MPGPLDLLGAFQQKLHDQRDRAAGSSFIGTGIPGCTCYIQVGPFEFFGEARKKTGSSDGTTIWTANVGHVGKIAIELFLVFIPCFSFDMDNFPETLLLQCDIPVRV